MFSLLISFALVGSPSNVSLDSFLQNPIPRTPGGVHLVVDDQDEVHSLPCPSASKQCRGRVGFSQQQSQWLAQTLENNLFAGIYASRLEALKSIEDIYSDCSDLFRGKLHLKFWIPQVLNRQEMTLPVEGDLRRIHLMGEHHRLQTLADMGDSYRFCMALGKDRDLDVLEFNTRREGRACYSYRNNSSLSGKTWRAVSKFFQKAKIEPTVGKNMALPFAFLLQADRLVFELGSLAADSRNLSCALLAAYPDRNSEPQNGAITAWEFYQVLSSEVLFKKTQWLMKGREVNPGFVRNIVKSVSSIKSCEQPQTDS